MARAILFQCLELLAGVLVNIVVGAICGHTAFCLQNPYLAITILQEFVKATEGHPDYWFWKDIVNKTRPRTIQGPVCSKRQPKLTKFDGWFLKFFPYDNKGKTPAKVDITQTMLPETVVVPFKYQVVNLDGIVLEETTLELVAGIVGVLEDPDDFAMTPKIGWFVRTVKVDNQNRIQDAPIDLGQSHNPGLKMEACDSLIDSLEN